MKKFSLSEFKFGWFIGDFEPSLARSKDIEVALKYYNKGDSEPPHYHAIAVEFTAIVSGTVAFNGVKFGPGDIVMINPGEVISFHAITDSQTVVVKMPSVPADKFKVEQVK